MDNKEIAKYVRDRIFKSYSTKQCFREHLGASQIGMSCKRAIWYQFRWCEVEQIDDVVDYGRIKRLLDHGNNEESRIINDLKRIGLLVHSHDPQTNKQWVFSALGGHYGCSLDGVVTGLPDGRWYLLECKTSNDKGFKGLVKHGVQADKPQHYEQMQACMALAELPAALYVAVNKNNDDIYTEIIDANVNDGDRLLNKAKQIVFAPEPLAKMSNDASYFECKLCRYRNVCHLDIVPGVNCRTCLHSTPTDQGWHCEKHNATNLSKDDQMEGCAAHLFIPALITFDKPVDATDDGVIYSNFKNGKDGLDSHTLSKIGKAYNQEMQNIMDVFGAKVVEVKHYEDTKMVSAGSD